MGPGRGFLSCAALLAMAAAAAPQMRAGGPGPPETAPVASQAQTDRPVAVLPPEVQGQLDRIQDFTYGFDEPGYYAVLEFLRAHPDVPAAGQPAPGVDDWRALLERPSSFRGVPITVTGIIGRNKDAHRLERRPDLGWFGQVELRREDQPITCTVIFTHDVSDLPVGATITVAGIFVKTYQYATQSPRPGLAALLVAPGPLEVSRPLPARTASRFDWRWLLLALTLGLLVAAVLLRRAAAAPRTDLGKLAARHEPRENLADDLARWAAREPPEQEEK